MNPWKRRFLLTTIIFRFHVELWGGTHTKKNNTKNNHTSHDWNFRSTQSLQSPAHQQGRNFKPLQAFTTKKNQPTTSFPWYRCKGIYPSFLGYVGPIPPLVSGLCGALPTPFWFHKKKNPPQTHRSLPASSTVIAWLWPRVTGVGKMSFLEA